MLRSLLSPTTNHPVRCYPCVTSVGTGQIWPCGFQKDLVGGSIQQTASLVEAPSVGELEEGASPVQQCPGRHSRLHLRGYLRSQALGKISSCVAWP